MIRMSWRQFQAQAMVAVGALTVIAVILAVTGPQLVHLYDTSVRPCTARGDCSAATAGLLDKYRLLVDLGNALVLAPALIGVFWGAPLVARELESGTFRLAWTQSVSRTHWLATKLGLVGLASVIVAELFSLMFTWWSSPLDAVNQNPFAVFDQRDIVPFGYAAFAFALGVTAGVLIRRTLPAMVTTLAVFAAVRLVVSDWVRPRLSAPVRLADKVTPVVRRLGPHDVSTSVSIGPGPNARDAWVLSSHIFDGTGHVVTNGRFCPGLSDASPAALHTCLAQFHQVVIYQPASRYWPFQFGETAIFLGLAAVLAAVCVRCVRHRLV
jgi:hypothetical protein